MGQSHDRQAYISPETLFAVMATSRQVQVQNYQGYDHEQDRKHTVDKDHVVLLLLLYVPANDETIGGADVHLLQLAQYTTHAIVILSQAELCL